MNFKNALVAGTGKSGISAAKLLIAHGVKVTLFDENEKRDKNDLMEKLSRSELVTILLGKLTDEVLKQTDIMVISPGIPVDSAFVEEVKKDVEEAVAKHRGEVLILLITGTERCVFLLLFVASAIGEVSRSDGGEVREKIYVVISVRCSTRTEYRAYIRYGFSTLAGRGCWFGCRDVLPSRGEILHR